MRRKLFQVIFWNLFKMAILAILAFVLHKLTLLPFLECCGVGYSIHILLKLFIENYHALLTGGDYASSHGRLF